MFIGLVVVALTIDVLGDYWLKKWAIGSGVKWLLAGLGIYGLANLFWAASMRYELLSKVIVFYSVLGVVAGIFVGVVLFQEKLSAINWAGFALGIVSLVLINI